MMRRALYMSCLLVTLLTLHSCSNPLENKWKITLNKDDKKPYGAYLANNSLKIFFPNADIKDLSPQYRFGNMDQSMITGDSGTSVMILTGLGFNVSDREWSQLQAFVREGNELVIFSNHLDRKITESVGLVLEDGGKEESILFNAKELNANQSALSFSDNKVRKFGYKGRSLSGYFRNMNAIGLPEDPVTKKPDKVVMAYDSVLNGIATTITDTIDYTDIVADSTAAENVVEEETTDEDKYVIADTLGYAFGRPNCLRIAIGRGHITLHAAPLATSNYFLLQDGNIDYLAGIWHSLPTNVTKIYWDDYYRHSSQETSRNALWNYESTRWGILLAMFVAGMYILFQMKRRQRIVPVIAPLRNDSVSFVETVGRLYYNKGNNANLAEKMIQQYLEWVRINCYISTNMLNEDFVSQLSVKSGQPTEMVRELVNMIHEVRTSHTKIDDAYLYQLYRMIQQFYKKRA